MTPAVAAAEKAGLTFELIEYAHDARNAAFGAQVAERLGLSPQCVLKTLIVDVGDGALAVALVPVSATLDLKSLARLLGVKRATMAQPAVAERATGYLLGGVSPFGQRKRLPFAVDESALRHERVYVSAGKRGLEMALAPDALIGALAAATGAIAR